MNFDEIIDRRGHGSTKWDGMARFTGVSASDGLPMWVADMDFGAPDVLQEAVERLHEQANYGYFVTEGAYKEAVAWWMAERHGWQADPGHVFCTYGLGNAIALCLHAYTEPGDEVIIFTPVYHEFGKKIARAGRVARECALPTSDGVYRLDLEAVEAGMTGRERAVLFSSPHNPAGRVWSAEELRDLAAFCARHDLILLSDEIHHDLVYPGHTHVPMPVAAPEHIDRIVVLTAASKTFNIAGTRIGNVTVPDPDLRARFGDLLHALDIQPNLFGVALARAAYSPRGAEWVDALVAYLDGNRRLFLDGVAEIPGLVPMPMQATYLAWVDFENTGMEMAEAIRRVKEDARIAPSVGAEFGKGGETFLRFNFAMPRARIEEAVSRLQGAFSDLQ